MPITIASNYTYTHSLSTGIVQLRKSALTRAWCAEAGRPARRRQIHIYSIRLCVAFQHSPPRVGSIRSFVVYALSFVLSGLSDEYSLNRAIRPRGERVVSDVARQKYLKQLLKSRQRRLGELGRVDTVD